MAKDREPIGELTQAFVRRSMDAMHAAVARCHLDVEKLSEKQRKAAARLEKCVQDIAALSERLQGVITRLAAKFRELEGDKDPPDTNEGSDPPAEE